MYYAISSVVAKEKKSYDWHSVQQQKPFYNIHRQKQWEIMTYTTVERAIWLFPTLSLG